MQKEELESPEELRARVLEWLESMRIEGSPYGQYKMSRSTEATAFSSCFAVFVRGLYNDLKNVSPKDRLEWITLIKECQDPNTGLFIDPFLKIKEAI